MNFNGLMGELSSIIIIPFNSIIWTNKKLIHLKSKVRFVAQMMLVLREKFQWIERSRDEFIDMHL